MIFHKLFVQSRLWFYEQSLYMKLEKGSNDLNSGKFDYLIQLKVVLILENAIKMQFSFMKFINMFITWKNDSTYILPAICDINSY